MSQTDNSPQHSSIVIVTAQKLDEFLLSEMDFGRRPLYLGRKKLLGGNRGVKDTSPYDTLTREILEEIAPGKTEKNFAPLNELDLIRKCILDSQNLRGYRSLLVTIPRAEGGLDKDLIVWGHTFFSEIPNEVFDIARKNVNLGREIINEGIARIISADELLSGKVLFAYASGAIMDRFLTEHCKIGQFVIPNPENVVIHSEQEIPSRYS